MHHENDTTTLAPVVMSARITALACALLAAAVAVAGAQNAAQAQPASLDAILKQVATYDGGIASAAMWQLRDYVYARKDDAAGRAECEAKLLAFLKGPATPSREDGRRAGSCG